VAITAWVGLRIYVLRPVVSVPLFVAASLRRGAQRIATGGTTPAAADKLCRGDIRVHFEAYAIAR